MPMKRFITGRGCPYNCTFCHNQILKEVLKGRGRYVRKMPVGKVIEEILAVKTKYPLTSVHFSDDTFILDRKWLFEFLKRYKEKVNIPFSCNVRADLIDKKVVVALKRAGCRAVSFGVESGNEIIRNQILGKSLDDETILKAAKLLRKAKIKFLTTNMSGIPGEEEKDILATLELNRKIRPNFTRAFIFDAFPKLPLTQIAIERGDLRKDYSLVHYRLLSHEPIIKTVDPNLIRNMVYLFPLLIKLPLPLFLIRFICKTINSRWSYPFGRILQGWQEAGFFNVRFIPGMRYFFHIYRAFRLY